MVSFNKTYDDNLPSYDDNLPSDDAFLNYKPEK